MGFNAVMGTEIKSVFPLVLQAQILQLTLTLPGFDQGAPVAFPRASAKQADFDGSKAAAGSLGSVFYVERRQCVIHTSCQFALQTVCCRGFGAGFEQELIAAAMFVRQHEEESRGQIEL